MVDMALKILYQILFSKNLPGYKLRVYCQALLVIKVHSIIILMHEFQ